MWTVPAVFQCPVLSNADGKLCRDVPVAGCGSFVVPRHIANANTLLPPAEAGQPG